MHLNLIIGYYAGVWMYPDACDLQEVLISPPVNAQLSPTDSPACWSSATLSLQRRRPSLASTRRRNGNQTTPWSLWRWVHQSALYKSLFSHWCVQRRSSQILKENKTLDFHSANRSGFHDKFVWWPVGLLLASLDGNKRQEQQQESETLNGDKKGSGSCTFQNGGVWWQQPTLFFSLQPKAPRQCVPWPLWVKL